MKFVTIAKDGIEGYADVPESALPHWLSYGWKRAERPPRAPRVRDGETVQESPETGIADHPTVDEPLGARGRPPARTRGAKSS